LIDTNPLDCDLIVHRVAREMLDPRGDGGLPWIVDAGEDLHNVEEIVQVDDVLPYVIRAAAVAVVE
jgi:hypothetical protein